ncbi:hypothetical protein BCR43DRAFT_499022 [Syncephalastrum racemosum]|uniref:Uncharacterized protein n=1 Tax=Syncephalastrum racemosum TaxID=13706 RepID=A0A1X2H1U6_SYNRA|nr:hypothetical protein BCR43DRAFT_499022 [Syncephalastrum racemosum]
MHRLLTRRLVPTNLRQQCRFITQDTASRPGYGQGFAPPQGSRQNPKLKTKRRDPAISLPAHLGQANNKAKATHSPQQKHREDMRGIRHQYAQELLQKHASRQAAAQVKQDQNDLLMKKENAALAKERQLAQEHEAEVMKMLELELQKKHPQPAVDRQTQRVENYKAHNQTLRRQRLHQLSKLYAESENFVTFDNLDEKIEEAMKHLPKDELGRAANLEEYILMSTSESTEVERRKEAIKEAMGL